MKKDYLDPKLEIVLLMPAGVIIAASSDPQGGSENGNNDEGDM